MEIKFVPPCCETTEDIGKDGNIVETKGEFEGHLIVDVPPFPERTRIKQKVLIGDFKGKDAGGDQVSAQDAIGMLALAAELAMPYIKSVHIKHLPSGAEANSVEDLFNYPAFDAVCSEVSRFFMRGCVPTKK